MANARMAPRRSGLIRLARIGVVLVLTLIAAGLLTWSATRPPRLAGERPLSGARPTAPAGSPRDTRDGTPSAPAAIAPSDISSPPTASRGSRTATDLVTSFVAALDHGDATRLASLYVRGEPRTPEEHAALLVRRLADVDITATRFDPRLARPASVAGTSLWWLYVQASVIDGGIASERTLLVSSRLIGGRWFASTYDESAEGVSVATDVPPPW